MGGEPAGMRNRMVWGSVVALAVVVLGGVGLLGVRLLPYWVAKYRGRNASVHGATLINAPLAGVDLDGAHLVDAHLQHADQAEAGLRRLLLAAQQTAQALAAQPEQKVLPPAAGEIGEKMPPKLRWWMPWRRSG